MTKQILCDTIITYLINAMKGISNPIKYFRKSAVDASRYIMRMKLLPEQSPEDLVVE